MVGYVKNVKNMKSEGGDRSIDVEKHSVVWVRVERGWIRRKNGTKNFSINMV